MDEGPNTTETFGFQRLEETRAALERADQYLVATRNAAGNLDKEIRETLANSIEQVTETSEAGRAARSDSLSKKVDYLSERKRHMPFELWAAELARAKAVAERSQVISILASSEESDAE